LTTTIVLDSGPLALVTQRKGVPSADACKAWLGGQLASGVRVLVPEIVDYEVRRELLRAGKASSVGRLDSFVAAVPDRLIALNSPTMRLAARLWAEIRNRGLPTADPKELDGDVILAAQTLQLAIPPAEFVVATTNVGHLARLVPADLWQNIRAVP
jgi:predicted nucleic acid-binding protein